MDQAFLVTIGALLMFINPCSAASLDKTVEDAIEISRRSVYQFGQMIACYQGIDTLNAAVQYTEYGCWCGPGGSGTPVDATDQCCYDHDRCYEDQHSECTPDELVYTVDYEYSRNNCGQADASVTCSAPSEYSWFERFTNLHKCGAGTCECDRAAAKCFADNKDTYSSSNLYISC
ncbi:phospholipase A2 AP-PLA2-I-like [Apostichopus japonicus]|uniref:phospholipase A2 AP-PLA2-I-like n=1 Tax=Stichopus japonicus TaxID=307972 RepID=UPI003AB4A374